MLDIFLLNFFHSLFDVFDVFQFFEMKFILFFRIKKNCSKNYSLYLMCLTWTIWQNFINFPFWRGNRQKSPKFRFEANISETVALHKKLKKEDYAFFFLFWSREGTPNFKMWILWHFLAKISFWGIYTWNGRSSSKVEESGLHFFSISVRSKYPQSLNVIFGPFIDQNFLLRYMSLKRSLHFFIWIQCRCLQSWKCDF